MIRLKPSDLNYKVLTKPKEEVLFHSVYVSDLLSNVLRNAKEGDILVTTIANLNTIAVASLKELSAVIFAEDKVISEDMIEKALEEGVCLLVTPKSAYQIALDLGKLS